LLFFFFQAEDGIRDLIVTGVQTCVFRSEGLRDASTRWVVTHDLAEWRDEIAWMSLYFSAAVWASLALCVCCSLKDHLPHYRTQATVASSSSNALAVVSKSTR